MKEKNHECYASLEVAKLLKEAGFDLKCRCYYETSGKLRGTNSGNFSNYNSPLIWQNNGNTDTELYSAPTLDVAQRWLREVKNLVLLIDITPSYCNGKPMGYKFVIHISCGKHIYGDWEDTYEEAQEAGIKRALEIILEEGE